LGIAWLRLVLFGAVRYGHGSLPGFEAWYPPLLRTRGQAVHGRIWSADGSGHLPGYLYREAGVAA
jgi:hypothetical protein